MANTGFKGVDVRQTGAELVFRALLQTSGGALVAAGTTNLYIMELQSDGTIKTYDFNDNTFKTTATTTENLGMTYRKSNNATTDTGLWTAALSTLSGFTVGSIYLVRVNNSTAFPTDQVREFQYGGDQGDLAVVSSGSTGISYIATGGPYKINTANGFSFRMVQSSDNKTGYTGGSVSGARTIAGASSNAVTGSITQIGSTNEYYFSGAAGDFNGTEIHFAFTASGANSVYITINTTP